MKREALGDSEVSQMDMTLLPLTDNMLYCRRKGFKELKDKFGEDWGEINFGSAWENIHREVKHLEEVDEIEEEVTEETNEEIETTSEEVKEEETKQEEAQEDEKKEETE